MSSSYRSTHIFSPISSPRNKHTEIVGTSANIATSFSASRNSDFNSLNRNSGEEQEDNNYLDINNIDHEAIRNDPELRGKHVISS
jgi:hypothetical protein